MEIKKLFVSYEIAKQMKEKGFDEECLAYYFDICFYLCDIKNAEITTHRMLDLVVKAPAFQQCVDWFREKHIHITVLRQSIGGNYSIKIQDENTMQVYINFDKRHKIYYEALDKAIKEALKLI